MASTSKSFLEIQGKSSGGELDDLWHQDCPEGAGAIAQWGSLLPYTYGSQLIWSPSTARVIPEFRARIILEHCWV